MYLYFLPLSNAKNRLFVLMKILPKIFLLFLLSSCANMVAPTGGEKDVTAPKLLNVAESVREENGQLEKIYFAFDEYIQLNQWEEHFFISPPIKKRIVKKVTSKFLELHIEDTLMENTTYLLSLDNCIKDINGGNILDDLQLLFSTAEKVDSLKLSGKLQDAYTLEVIENAWIMLLEENRNDSVIFKETPNYIAKTDKDGVFNFPNLKAKNYKIVALTDFDFIYNLEEKIAFSDKLIHAEEDSFISLMAFDPIVKTDSVIPDTLATKSDSSKTDSVQTESVIYGNLNIITAKNTACVFQLLQNEKLISEFVFLKKPYALNDIVPGKYQLKYIADSNEDGKWNTGNWERKIQAEKVFNYPTEITIRSNWDLELDWNLE